MNANKPSGWVDRLPHPLQTFFITVAGLSRFTGQFFRQVWTPPYEGFEVLRQMRKLGLNSLFLVGLSGFIIGLVLTMQIKPTMIEFGAEFYIPATVSISIIREIGPVLSALIVAGKVGSGIGAELGSMKVTEQIDAMAVSGANPFKYLVVTRVLAVTLMLPVLVFYADFVALLGGYVGVNITGNTSLTLYMAQALGAVGFADIFPATLKSYFFGFAVGIVGCHQGYFAEKGTTGVGRAANSSVVIASLLIFIIDMVAVQLKQFIL